MFHALRFLLLLLALLLAGVLDASAYATRGLENRVWKNFDLASETALENPLQVLEPQQEIWVLIYDPASGSTVWTKFDPEGLHAIYVAFPEQPIFVPDKYFGLSRLVTGADRNGYSTSLGHAGVVLIDPETGKSSYYDFGRYDPKQEGAIRSKSEAFKGTKTSLPIAVLGDDGMPTEESLERIMKSLSGAVGKNTKAQGVFIEGAKDSYEKQKQFAEEAYKQNNDPDRRKYSFFDWNCGDFARETINQGLPNEKMLPDTDARPAENVKEIQKRGQPVSYDPKATSTADPKPQPPPKREEERR